LAIGPALEMPIFAPVTPLLAVRIVYFVEGA
jgi:hypothetical protein